jgi:hypothetical protein
MVPFCFRGAGSIIETEIACDCGGKASYVQARSGWLIEAGQMFHAAVITL